MELRHNISVQIMSKVSFGQAYEERILPHLLWLTGRDGSCTVHPELAAALLRDIVLPTSAIVVPDAPVSALKEVAQLLHLGRYFVIRVFEYRSLQCLYKAEDNLSNQLQGLARVSAESAKSG